MSRKQLEVVRSLLIQLLNALDDALGYPRTIPPKSERRRKNRAVEQSAH